MSNQQMPRSASHPYVKKADRFGTARSAFSYTHIFFDAAFFDAYSFLMLIAFPILLIHIGDKAVSVLGKPFRRVLDSLLIQRTGYRIHNYHIKLIKACHQHGLSVL